MQNDLSKRIVEFNATSMIQAARYEDKCSWSYAYLSRWVVLEIGLKSLYDQYNKKTIKEKALEWVGYVDGKRTKVPEKIKDFSVQTQYIPTYKIIVKIIGESGKIKDAIDSNGKYRAKRNRIAHKAEEFRSENDYKKYRLVIDCAIKELINKITKGGL